MKKRPHIVILGAGPAGLGAAYQLAKRDDIDLTVIEATSQTGGTSRSIEVKGLQADLGSHRLHPACPPHILSDIQGLLGDDLLQRPRHGRIRLANRWVRFPVHPLHLLFELPPRLSARFAKDMCRGIWPQKNPSPGSATGSDPGSDPGISQLDAPTYRNELERRFGTALNEYFYSPYAKKLWGLPPEKIAAVQAEKRVAAGSLFTIARKSLLTLLGKKPFFYYPRQGFGQIFTAYEKAVRDAGTHFALGEPVTQLARAAEKFRIRTKTGRQFEADVCLSSLPLPLVAHLWKGPLSPSVQHAATQLRYRSMVLVYLVIQARQFTEFDAHYLPASELTCSRISEPAHYRASAHSNRTVLCAEIPCNREDAIWSATPEILTGIVQHDLEDCDLSLPPITHVQVERIERAYPVYDLSFADSFAELDSWSQGLENFASFGRQGLFVHDNSHHALEMGYEAADCVSATGPFDQARWQEARLRFAGNTVED